MKKNTQLHKKLQEILHQKSFEELEPFKNTKSWKALDNDDRNTLASLFVMQGEKQLDQGDKNAIESFELAAKVSPENPEIFFSIGMAFLNRDPNTLFLKHSEEAFHKVLKLSPLHFHAWVSLGNVYNQVGMLNHDMEQFNEAEHCYQQASACPQNESTENLARLHWHWGLNSLCLGKHSGEAVDFHAAIGKFSTAATYGLQDKLFWNTYGDTMAELACLIGRNDLFYEVIELYRNGVRQAFDFFEGWLNLACAFQRLFEYEGNEEHYHQSSECFKMASQIKDDNPLLWMKWAQLTAYAGKTLGDLELLNESFEKYSKAHSLDKHDALILGLWGEALLLYASHKESIELLHEAQQKINRSLELEPGSSETWYLYGSCFYELGRYFSQEDYFHQAVEKYQQGLSVKQSEPLLWYGLANAYFSIGDMRNDAQWIEKSTRLFAKVLEFKGHQFRPLWNDWAVALMKLAEMTGEKEHAVSAVEKFETIIPQQPEQWEEEGIDVEWLYNYGCALDFLGELTEETAPYEKSIQALSQVVNMDPDYTHARYNLALALAHLGELAMDVECFHKAIEQFQILLTQDSEDEMGWSDYGLTLLHLAQLINDPARIDQGQKLYEIAESKFIQAIALGCTQTYYNLACLYALQGNGSVAMHYLEKSEAAGVLPNLETLLQDEWLDNLRTLPSFKLFINRVSSKNLDKK